MKRWLLFSFLSLSVAVHGQLITPKTERHIFKGEINRQGKAVGCHHIRAISFYKTAQMISGTRVNGPYGIFKAKVKIKSASSRWITKVSNGGYSTFFPEEWSEAKTKEEILLAFQGKRLVSGDLYEGKCSDGWMIQFYLTDEGKIATAFPRDWTRR